MESFRKFLGFVWNSGREEAFWSTVKWIFTKLGVVVVLDGVFAYLTWDNLKSWQLLLVMVFLAVAGIWIVNGIIFRFYLSEAKTNAISDASSDLGASDLVNIGPYQVSRQLLERLIYFGYPQQRSGDPPLSWWHVPIMLNRIEGCPVRELKSCRVFLGESLKQFKMRWRSDQPEGSDTTDLRLGEDAKFIPIIERSEGGFTFRVGGGRGISTSAWIATITDEAFLLRGNPAAKLEYNSFMSPQSIKTGYRLSIELHCEEWLWRRHYWVYVPQDGVNNGHFVMFPSEIEGDNRVEMVRRSGSVV